MVAPLPTRDPWARRHLWRYTGPNSFQNRLRSAFPGLGFATVLVASYIAYDQLTDPSRAESVLRATAERRARQEHISELLTHYTGIGGKKKGEAPATQAE